MLSCSVCPASVEVGSDKVRVWPLGLSGPAGSAG